MRDILMGFEIPKQKGSGSATLVGALPGGLAVWAPGRCGHWSWSVITLPVLS